MKKLIPNPEYENARYVVWFEFRGNKGTAPVKGPEIRTNNPNFLKDGKGEIPTHIEVEENERTN